MIPLYDTLRSHKIPFITLTLIAANLFVFFHEIQLVPYALQRSIFSWGLLPSLFTNHPSASWPFIFTSMFLHGGWLHIISNRWVLYVFGHNVETSMGGFRYLIFYLLAGAAAALLQIHVQPQGPSPLIGASGAIPGVLGAYLTLFSWARIASLVGSYWWISFWRTYGIFICGQKESDIRWLAVTGPDRGIIQREES